MNSTTVCALMAMFLLSLSVTVRSDELLPSKVELSPEEQQMIDWVDTRRDAIVNELEAQVAINSGTLNVAGLDDYRTLLAKDLEALGFTTETVAVEAIPILTCEGGSLQFADHLIATRTGISPNRILLNGHMDTVFGPDDDFQTMTVDSDGTIRGPGVLDMKGGIVVMLNALRALKSVGLLEQANITVLLNSDEEMGSLTSRTLIEGLASEHDVGLIFEGTSENRMTRARKGLGQVRIKVEGREAHSGGAHEQGVSANLALAQQIVAMEALTDYERGVTVNVGVMGGGEKRNTIPGCADAYVDLRYPAIADGQYLLAEVEAIAAAPYAYNPQFPDLPKTEFWGVLHRPAKEENAVVDALIADAMGLSLLIGEPVQGAMFSGGGTDGSIAQSVGLPTVDSLGLDGSGAHSSRERTTVDSLIARTKLAAVMIGREIQAQSAR
ncbi:MAG: M20 family metallopeptidase [Pseudomonadota bacterium]